MWKIWKERNRRIFHSDQLCWDKLCPKIQDNVQEMVEIQKWTKEYLKCDPGEKLILLKWDLGLYSIHLQTLDRPPSMSNPNSSQRPPSGLLKL
jgi:hypothetical protein